MLVIASASSVTRPSTPSKGTWPQFRGRTGTVVEINLGEYGVVFGKASPREDGPVSIGRPVRSRGSAITTWRRVASEPALESCGGLPRCPHPRQAPHHSQILLQAAAAAPSDAIDYGDWSGSLAAAQCAACKSRLHRGHRLRPAPPWRSSCLDPATIGLVLKEQRRQNGELFWVGWGKPGSWIPDDDTDGDP